MSTPPSHERVSSRLELHPDLSFRTIKSDMICNASIFWPNGIQGTSHWWRERRSKDCGGREWLIRWEFLIWQILLYKSLLNRRLHWSRNRHLDDFILKNETQLYSDATAATSKTMRPRVIHRGCHLRFKSLVIRIRAAASNSSLVLAWRTSVF